MRITALEELASVFKDNPDTLTILKQATTDDDCIVRRIAVEALASGFQDDPDTLTILEQCANTDDDNDDSDVRGTAERWLKRLQQRNQK